MKKDTALHLHPLQIMRSESLRDLSRIVQLRTETGQAWRARSQLADWEGEEVGVQDLGDDQSDGFGVGVTAFWSLQPGLDSAMCTAAPRSFCP